MNLNRLFLLNIDGALAFVLVAWNDVGEAAGHL